MLYLKSIRIIKICCNGLGVVGHVYSSGDSAMSNFWIALIGSLLIGVLCYLIVEYQTAIWTFNSIVYLIKNKDMQQLRTYGYIVCNEDVKPETLCCSPSTFFV